jgi:hypothetical protein
MREIPLTQGKVTLVDDADYEWLSMWRWEYQSGYAVRKEDGRTIRMHREITDCPPGFDVDHINRNRLDNRRSNLRVVTRWGNNLNRQMRTGTLAVIYFANRRRVLGEYPTEELAREAERKEKERLYNRSMFPSTGRMGE